MSEDSILQKVVPAEDILEKSFILKVGQQIDRSNLISRFDEFGYVKQANVYSIGEYALRGGLLDIYIPETQYPLRLDFFGKKLENIRTFDPSSQRSNGFLKSVSIFPVSEVFLSEHSINTFRKNYRKIIGTVRTDDKVYKSISANVVVEGIEHWLPLFKPNLKSMFSFLNKATISSDIDLFSMIENKWKQINESRNFDLKTVSNNKNKLALLEPSLLYLSPNKFHNAIKSNNIKKINSIFTEKLVSKFRPPKDFTVARNMKNISLFNEVAEYIKLRIKKHSIIISGQSEGSIKRLLAVLKEHDLKGIKKIESLNQVSASSPSNILLHLADRYGIFN